MWLSGLAKLTIKTGTCHNMSYCDIALIKLDMIVSLAFHVNGFHLNLFFFFFFGCLKLNKHRMFLRVKCISPTLSQTLQPVSAAGKQYVSTCQSDFPQSFLFNSSAKLELNSFGSVIKDLCTSVILYTHRIFQASVF